MWEIELSPPVAPIIILFVLILVVSGLLFFLWRGIFGKTHIKIDNNYYDIRLIPNELKFLLNIGFINKHLKGSFSVKNKFQEEIAVIQRGMFSQNCIFIIPNNLSHISGSGDNRQRLYHNQEERIMFNDNTTKLKFLTKKDYLNRGLL